MKIILFDGVCNLCDFSVQFIIKHDTKGSFYFASQTSSTGKALMEEYELTNVDSLVLVEENRAYSHSDAVLHIAKALDGRYGYLYVFRFVPKALRDGVYRVVARYRYRIFGKKEQCMMPSDELRERFLK